MLLKTEQGKGYIDIILFLVIIGFLMSIASAIVPPYITDRSIAKSLASKEKLPSVDISSYSSVENFLKKPFATNDIQLDDDLIQIDKKDGQLSAQINYEYRAHLAYNIYIVLTFEHHWKHTLK